MKLFFPCPICIFRESYRFSPFFENKEAPLTGRYRRFKKKQYVKNRGTKKYGAFVTIKRNIFCKKKEKFGLSDRERFGKSKSKFFSVKNYREKLMEIYKSSPASWSDYTLPYGLNTGAYNNVCRSDYFAHLW